MSERYNAPYVGVSGVGKIEHQDILEQTAVDAGLRDSGYELVLAAKAMDKAQVDDMPMRKSPEWYPVGEDLETVFGYSESSIKILQFYCSKWQDKYRSTMLMAKAVTRAMDWLGGIQFDMLPWMYDTMYREQVRQAAALVAGPVILQCYTSAMNELWPEDIVEALRPIEDETTHVLFDASEGRGVDLQPDFLSPWIEAVHASGLNVAVGVAGGLDADAVEILLPPLLERHGALSWDAEAKLHLPDHRLDVQKAAAFLRVSAAVIAATNRS